MFKLLFSSLFILGLMPLTVMADGPQVIYLVRHAEKIDKSKDADLSPQGLQRAKYLETLLNQIPFDAVYATQFKRTQKTVSPIAKRLEKEVIIIDAYKPNLQVDQVTRQKLKHILIAGHSNTIPLLIEQLGGPKVTIEESEYNNLFILIRSEQGVTLQRLNLDMGVSAK